MFSFSKNRVIKGKIDEYFKTVMETVDLFCEASEYLLSNRQDEHFRLLAKKTCQHEAYADDVRRAIEHEMYEKSLLPETREDLFNIIETMDGIPNQAEIIVNMFVWQKTVMPKELKPDLMELLKLSRETTALTVEAAKDCLAERKRIKDINLEVDRNENIGDELEGKMITKVFASDMKLSQKLELKEFIVKFGETLDICKRALDKIVISGIKREA